jgi:hypothetical protein
VLLLRLLTQPGALSHLRCLKCCDDQEFLR